MAVRLRDNNNDIDSDAQSSIRPDFLPNPSADSASKLKDQEEKAEGQNADPTENVADQEQTAGAAPKQTGWKNNVSNRNAQRPKKMGLSYLKKIGPLAAIIGAVGIITIVASILFMNTLGPISFVAEVVDDLNYQVASLEIRHIMMTKNRLAKAEAGETVAGCTTLSIRCRLKSLTKKQIEKYDRAGIKMNYGEAVTKTTVDVYDKDGNLVSSDVSSTSADSNGLHIEPKKTTSVDGPDGRITKTTIETTFTEKKGLLGHYSIKSAEIDGEKLSAKQYYKAVQSDTDTRIKNKRSISAKRYGLSDNTFRSRVLKKLGLNDMKASGLRGSAEERAHALMSRANVDNVDGVKFIDAGDNSGNYKIEGDTSGKTYTERQVKRAQKALKAMKSINSPVGKSVETAASALNILGIYDAACSVKNMIGTASIAAKTSNANQMAEYSMKILNLVGAMKAGDLSPENAAAVGEFFYRTDNRKTIFDPETESEIANPNYGKSVMQSKLLNMSSTGQVPKSTPAMNQYSMGLSQNKLMSGFAGAADALETILNLGVDNTSCKAVQNWAVRTAGLLVGIGALVASNGADAARDIAKAILIMAAFSAVSYMINSALSGNLITSDMDDLTEERASALWTGIAKITQDAAQVRAMLLATTNEQITEYNDIRNQSELDFIAMESEDVSPFDISSQYSFIGVLLKSVGSFFGPSVSLGSSVGGALSLTSNSIGLISSPEKLIAKSSSLDRYGQCDDDSYEELGLKTDVQCNLVFVMPKEDLELDTDEVAKYMEDNNFVAPNTTTGLPEGYTPPDVNADVGFVKELILGFTDQFVNRKDYVNDYGKFLEFCVYRQLPLGNVYDDNNSLGDAGEDWENGKNCLKTGEPYNYFRIYTFDKSLLSETDGSN